MIRSDLQRMRNIFKFSPHSQVCDDTLNCNNWNDNTDYDDYDHNGSDDNHVLLTHLNRPGVGSFFSLKVSRAISAHMTLSKGLSVRGTSTGTQRGSNLLKDSYLILRPEACVGV